eukprot:6491895-Amphidinium_carterae.1
MGQATIEAQHIKQVIQEMTIPKLSKNINMSINTDSSAGKAVASRLGLNKKTKHVQLKYLYMQDIVQRGEMTITKIQTTRNPVDVLTKHLPAATINSHLERLCLQTTSALTDDATITGNSDEKKGIVRAQQEIAVRDNLARDNAVELVFAQRQMTITLPWSFFVSLLMTILLCIHYRYFGSTISPLATARQFVTMATSTSTEGISTTAPGPMDVDQAVDSQPMNDPNNPLVYNSDEVDHCEMFPMQRYRIYFTILATNEEQSVRSTTLIREQLIETALTPQIDRNTFNPLTAETDRQSYLWFTWLNLEPTPGGTQQQTMTITGHRFRSGPLYLVVWKTGIHNILTNSHHRGQAQSSIYFRRAEDVSIEFNPVYNGQEAQSLNFRVLMGRPIGVWTMEDWHRIDTKASTIQYG